MPHHEAVRPKCPECGRELRMVVAGIVTQAPTAYGINDNVTLTLRVGPTATGMSGLIEVGLNCQCGWRGPWHDIQDLYDHADNGAQAPRAPSDADRLSVALYGS